MHRRELFLLHIILCLVLSREVWKQQLTPFGVSLTRKQDVPEKTAALLLEPETCRGKHRLIEILRSAGLSDAAILKQTNNCKDLPSWKEVTDLYGDEPVVMGMETCPAYRAILRGANNHEPVVRVAGLYNTGTNNMQQTLLTYANFENLSNVNDLQVPWDKHLPASGKWTYNNTLIPQVNKTLVLPVVMIRDPYRWMTSMCKQSYNAHWERIPGRCPNLVRYDPNATLLSQKDLVRTFEVQVSFQHTKRQGQKFRPPPHKSLVSFQHTARQGHTTGHPFHKSLVTFQHTRRQGHTTGHPFHNKSLADFQNTSRQSHLFRYKSLADLWTSWYKEYFAVDYPRLIIRFEDTLFHLDKVMQLLSECIGVDLDYLSIKPKLKASKSHGKSSNFVGALSTYGTNDGRYTHMTHYDLEYASKALDVELMSHFHYLFASHQSKSSPQNVV